MLTEFETSYDGCMHSYRAKIYFKDQFVAHINMGLTLRNHFVDLSNVIKNAVLAVILKVEELLQKTTQLA